MIGATSHSALHTVENFKFYLGEPIQDPWVKLIEKANESIEIGMYFGMSPDSYFTQRIYKALLNADKRGVDVSVKFDVHSEEAIKYLRENDIEVDMYSDDRIHHMKGIVVDNKYVFVGSQNISFSALQGKNWSSGAIFKSEEMATRFSDYLSSLE